MIGPKQASPIGPAHQTAWDMRAAGNFIGGGTGSGLLIVSGLMAAQGRHSPALIILGLAFVGLGLLSVFFEIGRPFRAMNVMLHPKRSWMTREAYVAAPLFLLGGASLLWPALAAPMALVAVVYLFCQARILNAAKGIPTWRHPLVRPLIMATGLAEGSGVALLVSVLTEPAPEWLAALFLAAVGIRMLLWMAYRRRMENGMAPIQAAVVLTNFSAPFALGGNGLPLVLVVAAGAVPWLSQPALAAAGLAALIGGWAFKAMLVTRAAFNQGFAIPVSPVRGRGKPGPGYKPGWTRGA